MKPSKSKQSWKKLARLLKLSNSAITLDLQAI
jgi:hypothetical protein